MRFSLTVWLCVIYNNGYRHGHLSVTCSRAFGGPDKCDTDQFSRVGLCQWFTQLAYCIAGRLQGQESILPSIRWRKGVFTGENILPHKYVLSNCSLNSALVAYFSLFPHFCVSLIVGFKGKDCSVDIDLCSFGMCSEHTMMCTETEDGQNVTCMCERGKKTVTLTGVVEEN